MPTGRDRTVEEIATQFWTGVAYRAIRLNRGPVKEDADGTLTSTPLSIAEIGARAGLDLRASHFFEDRGGPRSDEELFAVDHAMTTMLAEQMGGSLEGAPHEFCFESCCEAVRDRNARRINASTGGTDAGLEAMREALASRETLMAAYGDRKRLGGLVL